MHSRDCKRSRLLVRLVAPAMAIGAAATALATPPASALIEPTPAWHYGEAGISADGTAAAAFGGGTAMWTGNDPTPLRIDLRAECGDEFAAPIPRDPGITSSGNGDQFFPDIRPSITADGSRTISWIPTPGGPARLFQLFASDHASSFGFTRGATFDKRGPRPHVSPDGGTVVAHDTIGDGSSGFSRVFELDGWSGLGSAPQCDAPGVTMGIAQPGFTADSKQFAATFITSPGTKQIGFFTNPGGWCDGSNQFVGLSGFTKIAPAAIDPSADADNLVDQTEGVRDLTISADGKVLGWNSAEDHCLASPTVGTEFDAWFFLADGAPAFLATCPPEISSAARLALPGSDESRVVVADDGQSALIVSDGDLVTGGNPNHRPNLFFLPLSGPTANFFQLTDVGPNQAVTSMTMSRVTKTIVYTVEDSSVTPHLVESRVITLGFPPTGATPDAGRPAASPFEVELTHCEWATGVVNVGVKIRQWKGGPRTLLITPTVTDRLGPATGVTFPVTETITDGQSVERNLGIFFEGTDPQCEVTVVDGSAAHADLVTVVSP